MQTKNANNDLSPEFHYKSLFFFGIFFLVASIFVFKTERSIAIPKFSNLFITEGLLKLPAGGNRHLPTIFVLSSDNRLIKLSTYRGYGIHLLRKFKGNKIKVWWYSTNLKQIYNPNSINSLYQVEINGQIIIKYDEQKKLFENHPKYNDTIFLASISFVFLLFALVGYLNMLDSSKSPKLK